MRKYLPEIEDGVFVSNHDEQEPIWTHSIALYVNGNNIICIDSSGVQHIPTEIKKLIGNKDIITNTYRIQVSNLTMRRYFCIEFIDFMLKGKSLLEHTYLFAPNDYEKNYKIILKYCP